MLGAAQVSSDESVQLIQKAYWRKLGGALGTASVALCCTLVVTGAGLGRLGTATGRGAGAVLLAVGIALVIYVRLQRTERAANPARVYRGIVRQLEPQLARKLLRAQALVTRAEGVPSRVSQELSELHLERQLAKIPLARVEERGAHQAHKLHAAAWVLGALTAVLLLRDPFRVIEGLNVLLARKGRAPVTTTWLELEPTVAHMPAYLRLPAIPVEFGTPLSLPKGSTLTVRGLERHSSRQLLLTDETREIPFVSDGQGGVQARFEVTRSSRLELAVRFGGVLVVQAPALDVSVVDDEAPSVVLEQAPKRIDLTGLSQLELRYLVTDDHGLRQVDLVLRSGNRQEQRQVVRLNGESRRYEGAHILRMDDPFIVQSAGPVSLVVTARDDNAVDGPKTGTSEALVLVPPSIGFTQQVRYRALKLLRDEWLDWFELVHRGATESSSKAHYEGRVVPAERRLFEQLGSGGRADALLEGFVRGQSEKLRPRGSDASALAQRLVDATLALDALLATLGQRDAEQVSRALARVADDLMFEARAARNTENRGPHLQGLREGLERLRLGAETLGQLGVLGEDLGQVALGGVSRIDRLVESLDLTNVERAASFLAERLARPVPSFLGGGGRPGVESGLPESTSNARAGEGERASEADTRFERLAQELRQLTEEHASATESVRQLVDKLTQWDELDSSLPEAQLHVERLRKAVMGLPDVGGEPGTAQASFALAKELTRGSAESLGRREVSQAIDGLRQAEGALVEAEQLSRVASSGSDEQHRAWVRAKSEIVAQRRWLEAKLDEHRRQPTQPSTQALRKLAPAERLLEERARAIVSRETKPDHVLPERYRDLLEQARALMSQAAGELELSRGPSALERQRAAQSLLEQLGVGQSPGASANGETHPAGARGGQRQAGAEAVTPTSDAAAREQFRRRVLEGLRQDLSPEGAAKIRRYAEGLLR